VSARLITLLGCIAALSACEKGLHQMYDQPKYLPLAPSALFPDGNSSRPQVADTVPHSSGAAAASSSGRTGEVNAPSRSTQPVVLAADGRDLLPADSDGAPESRMPLAITAALLSRGRERFNIYCAPCHSQLGDGDGMVVRRGFPAPPSFHTPRLRQAPDSHFYDVISRGYGVMYPYADRITPEERWAITAYIRALQLSQHAPLADLTAAERQRLSELKP
jgi:mono/diheme cytochrome c family protein